MARALSFDAFQQRRHILALDGLRALAIFGVLLHHTRGKPFWMFHGYRGVWVFFVLSGFLITTLSLREEAREGFLNVRAFMIRRVFRILPLYYLILAAMLVWVFVLGMDSRPERFADHLFAYIFYAPEFPIFQYEFDIPFGQTWSLGIEEKFYLVWPFLAFWLLARSRYRMAMTVVLIAISAVLTATSGWLAQMWGSYTDILIGCLVAQLLQQRAIYSRLSVLGETQIAWVAVLALGVGLLGNWTGNQIGECMFSVLAAVTLIALVMNERGPATILGQAWLVRLGVWSYAIYLTHGMVFDFVKPLVPAGRVGDVMTLLAMLIIDLPLCWLLHTYFEKPLIRVGKRLAARMPAVTRPEPASGDILEARDSSG